MDLTQLLQQNRALQEEIKRRIDHLSAINAVSAAVGHSLDLNVILNTALEAVVAVVGAEAAGISLIDDEAQEVVLRAQLGWVHDFVYTNPMRIPLGRGMSGQVITRDDVVVHNDLSQGQEFAVPSFSAEAFRSIAMAPMHARGQIIGILSIMSKHPNRIDEDIVAVLRSIADTVGVAIENARLHEQHVEQENRLSAILQATADGIIATDQDSRINWMNTAAARMLDVSAPELIGVPLREASIQTRIRDKLLIALSPEADESKQGFQVSLETGHVLFVLVSPVKLQSLVTGHDKMDGWVIVLQDITHIREAEIARVQFIQAAAHDMKNPLSVTHSSIGMIKSMVNPNDENLGEVIHIAQRSISRVQRLIDDMLHIEKVESGYGFRPDEVDLREMCYEISAQTRPLMHDKGIQFEMVIANAVPQHITVDREWMHRALYNYLENAAKYTPQDRGKVIFQIYTDEVSVHFQVVDNGPGIPVKSQGRVFERFYRVEERKDIRGSGLGLAIVKSVAEAHGGNVYVHSTEGVGSIFGMVIPLFHPQNGETS